MTEQNTLINQTSSGARAACGRYSVFSGPRKHSGEIFKSEIGWKACKVTFVSLDCLRWIKWIYTRTMNTIFSVYHFDLLIFFTIKLEGTPAAHSPLGYLTR